MRPLGQRLAASSLHIVREGRIVQPQPAVAGEHRDRFGEIVERLALHADQRVVAALQVEPLGDVVEQIGHAAFGIGRGDDAQRAAVRQMPEMLLGFGRAIGLVQLRPSTARKSCSSGSLRAARSRSSTAESVGL